MLTELVTITPAVAREWLKKNSHNRPLRPSHVETLRQAFERGEGVTTHQGIAFDTAGHLIDGQHRLAAIAQMGEGFALRMLVSRGLDRAAVFPAVDATVARRNAADVLGVSLPLAQTATFFARLYRGSACGITPAYLAPLCDFVAPHLTDLLAFCGTSSRTWSSAPVRAAAVLRMRDGDGDYTKLVYRAMVLSDFDMMPPSAKSVFRSYLAGKVSGQDRNDIFGRCLKVFDPACSALTKIQINNLATVLASVRHLLDEAVFGPAQRRPPVDVRHQEVSSAPTVEWAALIKGNAESRFGASAESSAPRPDRSAKAHSHGGRK